MERDLTACRARHGWCAVPDLVSADRHERWLNLAIAAIPKTATILVSVDGRIALISRPRRRHGPYVARGVLRVPVLAPYRTLSIQYVSASGRRPVAARFARGELENSSG